MHTYIQTDTRLSGCPKLHVPARAVTFHTLCIHTYTHTRQSGSPELPVPAHYVISAKPCTATLKGKELLHQALQANVEPYNYKQLYAPNRALLRAVHRHPASSDPPSTEPCIDTQYITYTL